MICGYPMVCGRPHRHRGHHGGFRVTTSVVVPRPLEREGFTLGEPMTPRGLTVVAEVIEHGSVKEAAACLGIPEHAAKGHLATCYGRSGATSVAQLALYLGWVELPAHLRHREGDAA